jgi:hypothetical protein
MLDLPTKIPIGTIKLKSSTADSLIVSCAEIPLVKYSMTFTPSPMIGRAIILGYINVQVMLLLLSPIARSDRA